MVFFIFQKRQSIDLVATRQTSALTWVGLGLMSMQFGILARLTWWEYSWDIMEPVTYFVTYGTAMAVYAYYVLTKQVPTHSNILIHITRDAPWRSPAIGLYSAFEFWIVFRVNKENQMRVNGCVFFSSVIRWSYVCWRRNFHRMKTRVRTH